MAPKKGTPAWNKGLKMSDEAIEHNRIAHTGLKLSAETKAKMSEQRKGNKYRLGIPLSPEHKAQLSAMRKGKPKSPEWRAKIKATMIKQRNNPERFAEWNRNVLKASHIKPNREEVNLLELLNNLFPNEYKYVGNGEVIIGGINPDFININGQKKVIELYGDHWHQGENPQDRIDKFAVYGFDCLIIWLSEFTNKPQRVISKIKKFHEK